MEFVKTVFNQDLFRGVNEILINEEPFHIIYCNSENLRVKNDKTQEQRLITPKEALTLHIELPDNFMKKCKVGQRYFIEDQDMNEQYYGTIISIGNDIAIKTDNGSHRIILPSKINKSVFFKTNNTEKKSNEENNDIPKRSSDYQKKSDVIDFVKDIFGLTDEEIEQIEFFTPKERR